MSFHSLSTDLVLLIAEWVATPGHIQACSYGTCSHDFACTQPLASLALVSRQLNQIATPFLYRTLVQVEAQTIPRFLRTLLARPELRTLVKRLVIFELQEIDSMDMLEFTRHDLGRLGVDEHALEYFKLDEPFWTMHLERGQWHSAIALLLLILPSLEEVDMQWSDREFFETHVTTALAYAAAQQRIPDSGSYLTKLKSATVAYPDTEIGDSINILLQFCALSSVTTAKIYMASEDEWLVPSPAPRYNAEVLEINNSSIAPEALVNILRCFPKLKKLRYENGGATVGEADFLPQYLGKGIAHLHDCLEELSVYDNEGSTWGDEAPTSVGSLVSFKKLKKLNIQQVLLLKQPEDEDEAEDESSEARKPRLVDILPAALEKLNVSHCEPDIVVQLRDVLDQRATRSSFLALKEVKLRFTERVSSFSISDLETLRKSIRAENELVANAKEVGVNIKIAARKFMPDGFESKSDVGTTSVQFF